MTLNLKKLAAMTLFCVASTQLALAEENLTVTDPNAGFSSTLSGGYEWQADVSLNGTQSTIAAVHQSETELAVLQILTMLEVNPAALADAERVEFTTKEFLEGLCKPFVCADTTKSSYVSVGDRKAWVLETTLGLAQYTQIGLTDAVFVATTTPAGYMQLYSVHTDGPAPEALKQAVMDAATNTQFE